MHSRRLAATLILLVSAAPAMAVMEEETYALGWTKDAAYYVYAQGMNWGEFTGWTVVSAVDGSKQELADQAAFDAFVAKHPLVKEVDPNTRPSDDASEDEKSPDGAVGVTDLDPVKEKTTTKKKEVRCSIKRGSELLPSAVFNLHSKQTPGIWAAFSPDGRRVLWTMNAPRDCHPSGNGDYQCSGNAQETVFDRAKGPRVQLVGKDLPKDAFAKAAAALDKAGIAVFTEWGGAQKPRAQTTVYAAKGQDDAAKKIAAALPGASVEPLTWKAPFDVVVALGAK